MEYRISRRVIGQAGGLAMGYLEGGTSVLQLPMPRTFTAAVDARDIVNMALASVTLPELHTLWTSRLLLVVFV